MFYFDRINNAGIALDGFDAEVVRKTFALNYHHVTDFNERILDILRPQGRIVILASMAGALNGYSSDMVKRFRNVTTAKEADALAIEYQQAAKESIDTLKDKGWKTAAYSVSKVSCNSSLVSCVLKPEYSVLITGLCDCLHTR